MIDVQSDLADGFVNGDWFDNTYIVDLLHKRNELNL